MKKLIVLSLLFTSIPLQQLTYAEEQGELTEETSNFHEGYLREEEEADNEIEAEEQKEDDEESLEKQPQKEEVIEEEVIEEEALEETAQRKEPENTEEIVENAESKENETESLENQSQEEPVNSFQASSIQQNNADPKTAEEWLEYAKSQTTSSNKLTIYIEGYNRYPNDNRFVDGINSSARSLLNWTTAQHQDGRYDVALDRYNFILSAPKLLEILKKETDAKRSYALQQKRLPTADQMVNIANSGSSSSPRLISFIEGYYLYPNDKRFEEGINKNAQALLNWAIDQHNVGRFDVAIGRYELILSAPVLSQNIRSTTESKLKEAREGIRSADVIYQSALNESTSSRKLVLYIEGYNLYPNDSRFISGINSSARSLLNWASVQHQEGRYDIALDRYNFILSAPKLSGNLSYEADIKRSYALQNKFPTADQLIAIANNGSSSSPRLIGFIEGYLFYPNDKRFVDGINNNAQSLLNWAIGQHHNGHYEVAIGRYELILSAPVLAQSIKSTTEMKLKEAKEGKRPANVIYQLAQSQSSSSAKLALYLEGYSYYPNDSRFLTGINDSARSLLNWAKKQHQDGHFDVAIDRYNVIINTPHVQSSIKTEARDLLSLAESGTLPDRKVITYATYNLTLSNALNTQLGLNPPPQTDLYHKAPVYIHSSLVDISKSEVINDDGVNIRTAPNLNSDTIYKSVNKGTVVAIVKEVTGTTWNGSNEWYQIKFEGETLYVHSKLVTVSQIATVNSKSNIRESASTSSHIYGTVSANTQFTIIKKVTGATWDGSNQWYEISYNETWRNAKPSDVMTYLDPSKNDMFQHLVLDKSVGVSAAQLNNILKGKGILDGLGQAFIDAGKTHSVNEIYLISHALLETGNGGSSLAKGIEVGKNSKGELVLVTSSNRSSLTAIRTTYNMYGYGAYDSDPKKSGAFYAYNAGWFTPQAAIVGGAALISNGYFARGQNTLYKMRWNHAYPSSTGSLPQYATDMGWATKQVPRMKSLYAMLDNPTLIFDIVKYK